MAEVFDPSTHPHRRYNPLTNEHVIVSPHRNKRPWLGQVEPPQSQDLPSYDPACYLCPGNTRAGGKKTEVYEHTYIFENDYAAVLPPPMPNAPAEPHHLLTTEPVGGGCDVLIFHPRHDLTIPRLPLGAVERIIEEWIKIYLKRGSEDGIKHVQIFENKGAMMGCSNPHPHGQIWSFTTVPTIPAREIVNLVNYSNVEHPDSSAPRGPHGKPCLLCEYAHTEINIEGTDRVVVKNDHWVALVPWWAYWPFEILLLPYRRHIPSIFHLTPDEKVSFADILSKVTKRYDNLFSCSFAYSMGIHQRPIPLSSPEDTDEDDIAHLHLHFSPPLLRSATVKKFMAGIELMAESQRDITPEQAAQRLRECSEIHYMDANTGAKE
ncbi:galactose-1-phosphate uridyl transferase [Lentinula raphanica]|uniref:Galactose-1-phosphate uridylyltransferase n=1 Tax=Lentinula raphanica TaxID=153919 RepID=A0AA38PHJ0_9AGAR|nr:galactose-1-phosphate uridyl transferase [Lentinula raphanica]KAJ3842755.1 galactose-1-phosphate uridyl transferase [Lentinula raphanica]